MALVAVLASAVAGCSGNPDKDAGVDAGEGDAGADGGVVLIAATCGCTTWGNQRVDGAINPPLNELSGLAASRTQPNVFYAHNDSGDSSRFFAINQTGGLLETFELKGGASNVDWEDISVGPCPAGQCVFIADTGDNSFVRTDYAIYRVPEPTVTGGTVKVENWEKFPFEYPNALHHNVEAMFVHPATGEVYLITKETAGKSGLFKLPVPLNSAFSATAIFVTELTIPLVTDASITGAAIDPCGTAVLVRMYNRLVEYRLPAGAAFESMFTSDPVGVPFANEDQGEAVTYAADARGYFTSSETLATPPPVYEYRCR